MIRNSVNVALSVYLLLLAQSAVADLAGEYRLSLEDSEGNKSLLAQILIRQEGSAYSYQIDWHGTQFENHFLSMRPFKCLPHALRMICRLPYPYQLNRRITEQDLTDLEYDILFLHKAPGEYGINAWNGLYYKLQTVAGGLLGELHEVDLNVLQAPPEDGNLRPIDPMEIHPASDNLWPRRILIEPANGAVK
ncbi:MAG: hypothetical protein ABW139_17860 [Candidatus Thiodiazotropha sp. DIVDIV]